MLNPSTLRKALGKIKRFVGKYANERELLAAQLDQWKGIQKFPPGHFHSPALGHEDLAQLNKGPTDNTSGNVPGVSLNLAEQKRLLKSISRFYSECPFGATREERGKFRYYFDNGFYSYGDGLLLYCLLRHLRPEKYIEIGSGFSSCLAVDVNEHFLGGSIDCTFVEPYPDRLLSNVNLDGQTHSNLIQSRVQDLNPAIFEDLEPGDILFVDSSHVSKFGSDVNFLIFNILPRLNKGVWVHFHDIFYPFEYPAEWLERGWSWNEAYVLRSFLSYNAEFKIRLWGDALATIDRGLMESLMPKLLLNQGAGIWIERI